MVVIDVLGSLVAFGMAAAATIMLGIGVCGALGALRFTRCQRCRHLMVRSIAHPDRPCPHCRHAELFHQIQVGPWVRHGP